MKVISADQLTKDIHFPVTRACYTKPPERNFFQNVYHFATYRRKFEVMQDYVLWIPLIKAWCFVPISLIFDAASVPKAFANFYASTGMLLLGALPHDVGYRYEGLVLVNEEPGTLFFQKFTKEKIDDIFRNLCTWESGMPLAVNIATGTLRAAGFIQWSKHRKANRNFEEDFPKYVCGRSIKPN
jgi:hypothetical protein